MLLPNQTNPNQTLFQSQRQEIAQLRLAAAETAATPGRPGSFRRPKRERSAAQVLNTPLTIKERKEQGLEESGRCESWACVPLLGCRQFRSY